MTEWTERFDRLFGPASEDVVYTRIALEAESRLKQARRYFHTGRRELARTEVREAVAVLQRLVELSGGEEDDA